MSSCWWMGGVATERSWSACEAEGIVSRESEWGMSVGAVAAAEDATSGRVGDWDEVAMGVSATSSLAGWSRPAKREDEDDDDDAIVGTASLDAVRCDWVWNGSAARG